MGNVCHKQEIPLQRKAISQDYKLTQMKGTNETIFEEFDKVNIFKYYNIQDFMHLFLSNFDRQEGVSEAFYYVFIEKKFIKNQQISEWLMNDESAKSQVQDYHQKLFGIFLKGFKSYYRSLKGDKYQSNNLPLSALLALGTHNCQGRLDSKIEIVFHLFCNKDLLLEMNDDLCFFIFASFCLPAGIFLFVLKVLSEENEDYKAKVEKHDFVTIFDTYQIKDAINATQEYLKLLFTPDKPRLSFEDFRDLVIRSEDIQSIFSSTSIRAYLEKHNI